MARLSIAELLNQVWIEFRKAGITDDVAIVGQIAYLLLEMQGETNPLSSSIPVKTIFNRSIIDQQLREVINQHNGDIGDLFDRYVLFRMDKMLPGGRYPTPRHIVKHILTLANINSTHSLADFACGTGGFLVYAGSRANEDVSRLGIEISPEWSNLALANVSLHKTFSTIINGNALREYSNEETQLFDRVIMNPPFGESIDTKLAKESTGFVTGSISETALTALALKSIGPDGKAAILVPSGVLQNTSRSEKELRRRILDNFTLEAVVTYPKEAFQPFSTLTTHLLLISNGAKQPSQMTWFFKPAYDGYSTGRGRDLTKEPESPNDLLLVENLYQDSQKPATYDSKPLRVPKVENGGYIVQPDASSRLLSVRYYDQLDKVKAFILITIQNKDAQNNWHFSLENGDLNEINLDLEKYLKQYYQKSANEQPKSVLLFQNQQEIESIIEAIAIDPLGTRVLGVAVAQETLHQRFYSLDPEEYLKTPNEEIGIVSSQSILKRIRDNQWDLSNHIETLLDWLIPSGSQKSLPSQVTVKENEMLEKLSHDQQKIWKIIQGIVEKFSLNGDNPYFTGRYFTTDSPELSQGMDPSTVKMTLDILEQMGLIVLISQKNPIDEKKIMTFYRLVEERDEWKTDVFEE